MSTMQPEFLVFSPFDGHKYERVANPQCTEWFRVNASEIWTHNPWTGEKRDDRDVKSDPYGLLIWLTEWGPVPAAMEQKRQGRVAAIEIRTVANGYLVTTPLDIRRATSPDIAQARVFNEFHEMMHWLDGVLQQPAERAVRIE